MSFEDFVGNGVAIARLKGILKQGRPAHAYLFAGPEGVGKKKAALAFAEALGAPVTLIERPEEKHEILIAQIRELIRQLSFASAEPRAILVNDAHLMSEEAMNSFLKTLEEPPARTLILLISHVPDRLLGTIRSRCQTVHFAPLPDDDIAAYARTKLGLSDENGRALAALAEGSLGAALLGASGIEEIKTAARDLQTRALSGELNPLIEALGRIRDTEEARKRAKRDMRLLALSLREALRARSGAPLALATPEFVEKLKRLDEDALTDRLQTLLDHERMIDLNANVGLTVEDALLRM